MPGLVVLLHLNPGIAGMFVLKSRNNAVAKKRDKVNFSVKSWTNFRRNVIRDLNAKFRALNAIVLQ
jgi:hypothetical protein